jgi:hypothetical protein
MMKVANGGMVTIWARDFDKGSSHPCPDYKLYFAFSRNIIDTARTFTCADLGTRTIPVYVGVIVGMDTIWNNVNPRLVIQDNNTPKACPTTALSVRTVRGQLTTEIYSNLKGATVSLEGFDGMSLKSDRDGNFEFNNVVEGYDYIVRPTKNDDVDNGVNTLDLLMIQRHILNIQRIQSPYKMIAADINSDKKISVSDLSDLRKVVLGVSNTFDNNQSWRFVDKNHKFGAVEDALSEIFAEQYDIREIKENMSGIDFMSVKVGDIDATAATSLLGNQLKSRSSGKAEIFVSGTKAKANEIVRVPIALDKAMTLSGIQLGLIYDQDVMELVESELGFANKSQADIVVKNGQLKISWIEAKGEVVKDIAYLTFKAKKETDIAEGIKLGTFGSEGYTMDLETVDLVMRNDKSDKTKVSLFQNTPNPYAASTSISFFLPESMTTKLSIYDVQGRLVKQVSSNYENGMNYIIVDRDEVGKAGVYYYTLEAGNAIITKKMVIID